MKRVSFADRSGFCCRSTLHAILDLPRMVQDVPRGPAHEVARLPQGPTTRAPLRHLVRYRERQGAGISILDCLHYGGGSLRLLVPLAPVDVSQVAVVALDDMV